MALTEPERPSADRGRPRRASEQFIDDRLANWIGRPRSIPADLRAALQGLQPYNRGDLELLGQLGALDDLDKHRFPPVQAALARVSNFSIGQLTVRAISGPRVGPIEDGTDILTFEATPETQSEMQVSGDYAFNVAFSPSGPAEGALVIPWLYTTRDLILKRVVSELRRWL